MSQGRFITNLSTYRSMQLGVLVHLLVFEMMQRRIVLGR